MQDQVILNHIENKATYIPKLHDTSVMNADVELTGKELHHEKIFQRRNPERLNLQLSEIQRTILNPGLAQLAAIRMKGLKQIDHQASGWTYPIVSSQVNKLTKRLR